MKIENHILDILQLHEYGMAIGQSLDYRESCDLFIKLLLKRKNLNAAWILEKKKDAYHSTYAIPLGDKIAISAALVEDVTDGISESIILDSSPSISVISPIKLVGGRIAIFNLEDQGYLFLYSKKDNISAKDLSQLRPVIKKFYVNLKACRAFRQQQKLLRNLEMQNQELSDYAHMVSHDLKSPLRSIDTLTTWLQEDYATQLDEGGKKQIASIRTSVEKMDTLISGILEYSTIGKTQIEAYPVDLNLLLKDILSLIQIPEHITVTINTLPTLVGDKYRLQQLFQNLVGNAVSYNDKKEGKVHVGVADKGSFWEFYVQDNGKGIPDPYFKKIFKVFEKLETNETSTGIGLSIVKKIVEMYQGDIWLESEEGIGTTFYFTLAKKSNGTA